MYCSSCGDSPPFGLILQRPCQGRRRKFFIFLFFFSFRVFTDSTQSRSADWVEAREFFQSEIRNLIIFVLICFFLNGFKCFVLTFDCTGRLWVLVQRYFLIFVEIFSESLFNNSFVNSAKNFNGLYSYWSKNN